MQYVRKHLLLWVGIVLILFSPYGRQAMANNQAQASPNTSVSDFDFYKNQYADMLRTLGLALVFYHCFSNKEQEK